MPTISEANNMQIRPPMDVMITLQVGDDVPLTYSGYSSAKVADGRLNEPNRKMMPLTDLQGDGYSLDSYMSMYDPDTHVGTQDKWGVRSNVGEPVSITITATDSIKYVSAWADGCSSVTYNGNDYAMVAGSANVYIEDSTATLTFNPLYDDRRVEVSLLASGSFYIFDNTNIISCIVSLRSDLSLINPTLPESEIEIQAFWDEDISERLASIPDETLITYSAGYSEQMSQTRNFYLAERITWKDNVMTIRAVDAVHKLDVQLPTATLLAYGLNAVDPTTEYNVFAFLRACLRYAGVTAYNGMHEEENVGVEKSSLYFPMMTIREAIAILNAWFRFGEYLNNNYWLSFVDAGAPVYRDRYSTSYWDIYEEDCGDVKRDVDRNIKEIRLPVTEIAHGGGGVEVGSGTWIYGSGVFLDFDDNVHSWRIQDEAGSTLYSVRSGSSVGAAILEMNALNEMYVRGLMQSGLPMGSMRTFYTQVMPWNSSQLSTWNADIGSSVRTDQQVKIIGVKLQESTQIESFSTGRDNGEVITLDEAPIPGKIIVKESESSTTQYTLYPDMAVQSILNMSNVTGSFKWKGDPRMQPRDSAYLHRTNGTVELITIENITITHEGGGTSAEITYRKGKC